MGTHTTIAWGQQGGRSLFDTLSAPTGDDAERLERAILLSLRNGSASVDLVRERAGLPGTNRVGLLVSSLRRRGLIVADGTTKAQAKSARGRLTRTWRLTLRGEAEAQRLAGQPPAGAD